MNKLTSFISDLILDDKKYRGIPLFQHTGLTDNVNCIVDLLCEVSKFPNGMPCKCDSTDMSNLVESLNGYSGASCDGIRKNFFPDLETLGFIKRGGRGRNWDFVYITNYGIELISETDDFKRKLIIQNAYHRHRFNNKEFCEFINRVECVVGEFGNALWWEVWMCMRLDIEFDVLKNKMVGIRKMFRIKRNTLRGIKEVTKLFLEHNNKQGQKQNGVIDFNNVINKVSCFGIKATFFFFSVEGTGKMVIMKSQFDTTTKKAQRTHKRDPFYVKNNEDTGLEYHHIVPFENVHYNLTIHEKIDCRENLLPITKNDHNKFPKVNNSYVLLKVVEGKVRFYSLSDINSYIEIENDEHLNIELIREKMVDYNKKLISITF